MARKAVVEVQCERCSRKEMQELPPLDANGQSAESPPAFKARLQPLGSKAQVDVVFGDLCGPCLRTVTALFEQISKKVEGLSPDRAAKPKETNTAQAETKAKKEEPAPTAPAPRPHAAAKLPTTRSS